MTAAVVVSVKWCGKCEANKPHAAFGTNRNRPDGLSAYCKECKREASAQYARRCPARVHEVSAASRAKNAEAVRNRNARYYETHRESIIERTAANRLRDAEKTRVARERHRVQGRASHLAWYAEWYPRNAARKTAITAAWRITNPEKAAALSRKRRAAVAGAPGRGITARDWSGVVADSLGLCAYCSRPTRKLTLDHIEPLSKGGEHDVSNAAACCASCNSSKNDTSLLLWLATRSTMGHGNHLRSA